MEFSISSSIQEPSSGSTNTQRKLFDSFSGFTDPQGLPGQQALQDRWSGSCQKGRESACWKINSEKSHGEGLQATFRSLNLSQIKFTEKGKMVLQACYSQEPSQKNRETRAEGPG